MGGTCRLYQGELDNQKLVINATLTTLNHEEAIHAYNKTIIDIENSGINMNTNNLSIEEFEKESFFRKLFINLGKNTMLIDMEKLEILENNTDFELLYSNNKAKELLEDTALDHYKNIQDRSLEVKISKTVSIIVSSHSNLQIRTSVFVNSRQEIKNTFGPLVCPLNKV